MDAGRAEDDVEGRTLEGLNHPIRVHGNGGGFDKMPHAKPFFFPSPRLT